MTSCGIYITTGADYDFSALIDVIVPLAMKCFCSVTKKTVEEMGF